MTTSTPTFATHRDAWNAARAVVVIHEMERSKTLDEVRDALSAMADAGLAARRFDFGRARNLDKVTLGYAQRFLPIASRIVHGAWTDGLSVDQGASLAGISPALARLLIEG